MVELKRFLESPLQAMPSSSVVPVNPSLIGGTEHHQRPALHRDKEGNIKKTVEMVVQDSVQEKTNELRRGMRENPVRSIKLKRVKLQRERRELVEKLQEEKRHVKMLVQELEWERNQWTKLARNFWWIPTLFLLVKLQQERNDRKDLTTGWGYKLKDIPQGLKQQESDKLEMIQELEQLRREKEKLMEEVDKEKREKAELKVESEWWRMKTEEEECKRADVVEVLDDYTRRLELLEQREICPYCDYTELRQPILFDIEDSKNIKSRYDANCGPDCMAHPLCRKIWEEENPPYFASDKSERYQQFKKFASYLESFSNIEHDMSPNEVLQFGDIKSFKSEISEKDKLLCAEMHIKKLKLRKRASDFKKYREYLYSNSIHYKVFESSRAAVADEIKNSFDHIFIADIVEGLRQHMQCVTLYAHRRKNILIEDLEHEISDDIERRYNLAREGADNLVPRVLVKNGKLTNDWF